MNRLKILNKTIFMGGRYTLLYIYDIRIPYLSRKSCPILKNLQQNIEPSNLMEQKIHSKFHEWLLDAGKTK